MTFFSLSEQRLIVEIYRFEKKQRLVFPRVPFTQDDSSINGSSFKRSIRTLEDGDWVWRQERKGKRGWRISGSGWNLGEEIDRRDKLNELFSQAP